jgi:hypothetical protein
VCAWPLPARSAAQELFNYVGRVFSLKTTLLVAEQMLDRIEQLHSRNFIHR